MINLHNTGKYNTTPKLNKMGMTRCTDCGHLLPIDAKECTNCGISMETQTTIIKKSKINTKSRQHDN